MKIRNFFSRLTGKVATRRERIDLFSKSWIKHGDFATAEIYTIFELINARLKNAEFQAKTKFIATQQIFDFVIENQKALLINLFKHGFLIINSDDFTIRNDAYMSRMNDAIEIELAENEVFIPSETFGFSGQSDYQVLKNKIDYLNTVSNSDWALIENYGAMGIISPEGKGVTGDSLSFDPDDRKRLQDDYDRHFGLKFGKWKLIISNSSIKFQRIHLPIKELELLEKKKQAILEICAYMNFPKELHPYFESSKYKNLEEAEVQCYTNCIQSNAKILIKVIESIYVSKRKSEKALRENEFWFDFNNVYSLENAKHQQVLRIEKELEFWQKIKETEPHKLAVAQERIDNLIENL